MTEAKPNRHEKKAKEKPGQKFSRRRRIVEPAVRFEFSIPEGVPEYNEDMYIWEKLRRLCIGLSKNGLKVTPILPASVQRLLSK
jgi:hypothetical protein